MYTTIDESGRLNNYAKDPEMYLADYPSLDQQRIYAFQGGAAILFVTTLLLVAFSVS